MYSSSHAKMMISAPKENAYRGYRVSPPNRADYASAEAGIHPTSLPTYRVSPAGYETYENTHYLQKSVNVPGYYRTKRPVEMTEILENDRIIGLNSNQKLHEAHSYNYYDNPHDILKREVPFLSTRAGSNRDEEHLLDNVEVSNITQRGTPSSRKSKANAYFMAEKVYSMKMRSQGIMAALTPLWKSKNPNQTQFSSKNTTPAHSQSAFREIDEYSSMIEHSYKPGDTSLVEIASKNQSMLQKNMSTSSLKSLEKSNSVKKGLNMLQSSVVKRENSLRSTTKSPCRSAQSDKKLLSERNKGAGVHSTPYQLSNTLKKEKCLKSLATKTEMFANKISTTMWQICQRNKRLVLVMLLEILHQHKLKITQYLERKATILKSKYFSIWQKVLLDAHLERQKIEQEKAEERKCGLAEQFNNRKLFKKVFNVLRTLDKSKQETFKQNTGVHSKSAKILRQSSTSSLKSAQNRSTPRNTSHLKASTPKSNTTKSIPREKSIEKNNRKSYTLIYTSKRQGKSTRSKSTEKDLKETCAPLSSRAASTHKLMIAKNELNKSEIIETPAFKESKVRFPTFGKASTFYYEPSEIQELTELSQSLQKEPICYKSSGLNQSFGCENLDSSENVQGGFDSILSEILNGPGNSNYEPTNAPSFPTPQPAKKEGQASAISISNASPKKDNFEDIKMPQSARDYLSSKKDEKELSRSHSLSAIHQAPTKNNVEFSVICLSPNKLTKEALKKNKLEPEELKTQKAMNFHNKNLCQKSLNSLMCGDENFQNNEESQNDLDKKLEIADAHYYNNLKIKILSGLLENYVHAYKSKERCKEHYEKNLLKNCFSAWSKLIPKSTKEDQVSEATYNEIVKRFRFIVLTEKALRQWKNLVNNDRRFGTKQN